MYTICRVLSRYYRISTSCLHPPLRCSVSVRYLSTAKPGASAGIDPRLGKVIHDEYARIREHYGKVLPVLLLT